MSKYLLIIALMFYSTLVVGQNASVQRDTIPPVNKKKLITNVAVSSSLFIAGIAGLGFVWYKDTPRVPFHFYDDSKGYLQMDKAGHAFGAYWISRIGYNLFRSCNVSKKKSLLYGASFGLIFQTPIEIFDGLYEGWGFSWYDTIANTSGFLLFSLQEAIIDEQIAILKFSYSPSGYPRYHKKLGETQFENFFLDYNGHTYWLSVNLRSLIKIKKIPAWLNIAFGYSANGMIGEFKNPEYYQGRPFPHIKRYRQFLFSLDVDFSRIPTKKKWLKTIFSAINMLKVPFPALEINSVDGFQFRPLYF